MSSQSAHLFSNAAKAAVTLIFAVLAIAAISIYPMALLFAANEYGEGRFKAWIRVLDAVVSRDNPELVLPWGGTEVCTDQMIPRTAVIDVHAPCESKMGNPAWCVAYSYEEELGWLGPIAPGKSETYVMTREPLDGIADLISDPAFHDELTGDFAPSRFHHDRVFLDREISTEKIMCSDYYITKIELSARQSSFIPITSHRFRND